jgi:hypothetical protein
MFDWIAVDWVSDVSPKCTESSSKNKLHSKNFNRHPYNVSFTNIRSYANAAGFTRVKRRGLSWLWALPSTNQIALSNSTQSDALTSIELEA